MQPSPILARIINGVRRKRMIGMRMVMQREAEFASKLQAQLTGIALDPGAREYAEIQMDTEFTRSYKFLPGATNELIIGSGFHSAVYSAIRVLQGYRAPLVIETAPYVGGAFAIRNEANQYPGVFFLNSRNRRGMPGLSGDSEAQLNYLPGAPIQAAALSNEEYQTNADMAFIIRLTLAQYSAQRVFPNTTVTEVRKRTEDFGDDDFLVSVNSPFGEETISTKRVIDARGLGVSKDDAKANGKTILTFPQFMARMAGIWPLRGLRNVAVLGAGDSGKCAVESLLGLSPGSFMGAAELDTVNRIDWYGDIESEYEAYCENNRGRYRAIGRYLRPDKLGIRKLNVFNNRVSPIALPDGPVLVGGRAYDLVILATGNAAPDIPGLSGFYEGVRDTVVSNTALRRRGVSRTLATREESDTLALGRFRIGPRADIPFDDEEYNSEITGILNNRVAMFRLATRTAALAASLS